MDTQYLQAIAAVASAVAAAFAAFAAIYGPVRAAKEAERLRSDSELENEERRIKLGIFATLLGDRRNWTAHVEAIRALNTIDLAFRNSPDVREAWAYFQQVLVGSQQFPDHERHQREDTLLAEMAKDLGLSPLIRGSDFGRFSNPMWRNNQNLAAILQANAIIATHSNVGDVYSQQSEAEQEAGATV